MLHDDFDDSGLYEAEITFIADGMMQKFYDDTLPFFDQYIEKCTELAIDFEREVVYIKFLTAECKENIEYLLKKEGIDIVEYNQTFLPGEDQKNYSKKDKYKHIK